MTKKNRRMSIPLDLDNCQTLEHLQPIPKSRSSSITSIETSESDGSTKMKQMLLPPPIREFDELTGFESFIRDETWDNEFDYFHAHLSYYPPFIMKECHDNLDKIKPTMNKNSRKFKRQLQHHIKNHLLKDLEKCCGYELNMEKIDSVETPDKIVWKFKDESHHGFSQEEEDLYDRHWKLELEISCNNESPLVDVNYKSIPL